MDTTPASGRRIHFSVIATSTPKLLVGAGSRQAVVFSSNANVILGVSGSLSTMGMYMAAGQGFTDNYSIDEWWVIAQTGSGTVSGFTVV